MSILEGTELVQKLGEFGEASIDVTSDLKVIVALSAKIDLLAEVKKLADKTATPYDNAAIAWLEKLIGTESAVVEEEKTVEPAPVV